MKKTKIICTIGPATSDIQLIKQLIENGMNAARFNFSHGKMDYQKPYIEVIKKAREELKKPVALILDTQGPEIRLGMIEQNEINLVANEKITLCTNDIIGNKKKE